MTSRPLLHRLARGRRGSARSIVSRNVSDRSGIRVQVSVTDFATSITQSFLILPGQFVRAELTGWVETGNGPRVLRVPLTIRAQL